MHVLRGEHREIERLLGALDRWARALAGPTGCDDPRTEAARFVSVLRGLVADFHHAREEGIVFEVLEQSCASRERGHLAVMTHEHHLLDGLISELDALAGSSAAWDATQRERATDVALTYADLLRRHILKEEAVIYPMAETRISESGRAEIEARLEAFARSEGEDSLCGLRRRTEALVLAHATRPS
jgi:hemerythrin-like domain-containing protein